MEDSTPPSITPQRDTPDGVWTHGPVQLARGRAAKDPNAQTTTYNVSSLDDFEASLREYLANPPDQPEHSECQLSFWIGASFMVSLAPSQPVPQPPPPQLQAPQGYLPVAGLDTHYASTSNASGHLQHAQHIANPATTLALPSLPGQKTSMSILEALALTADPKEKMKKQRAIAKTCVDSIQRVDGYRYSFHNCWNSREDDSFRFSYYCNDSLLNKDRAANGKGAKYGKRATKPVYDCRGVLSVKFSAIKQSLDVFYKHIPIHKTYEERAPPPRKDSKRRRYLEVHNPEALARIAQRTRKDKPELAPSTSPKPKKKKAKKDKDFQKQTAASSIESDLRAQSLRSLLELIQTDTAASDVIQEDSQNGEFPIQHSRRKSRSSCDICKAKKTKCDGMRPTCKTCTEKSRPCIYSDGSPDETRQTMPEPSHQTAHCDSIPTPHEETNTLRDTMTELEKLKAELAEAKSRIGQLEAEKTRSGSEANTSSHTLQNEHAPQPPPQQIQLPQYQTPQTYTPPTHPTYPPANRPMHGQGAPHPTHSPVNHQLHTPVTGLPPSQDSSDPYTRDLRWAPFYGYRGTAPMHPPPQQQQDQWGTGRPPGVFP